jgi:uncharacterized small protein (DUF1192 family)
MEHLIKLRLIYAQYEKHSKEELERIIGLLFDEIDRLEVGLYERD